MRIYVFIICLLKLLFLNANLCIYNLSIKIIIFKCEFMYLLFVYLLYEFIAFFSPLFFELPNPPQVSLSSTAVAALNW